MSNSGQWDITNNADLTWNGGTATFTNTSGATLRKSGGTGLTSCNFSALDNAGSIEVLAGSYSPAAGTHTGSLMEDLVTAD